MAKSKERDRTPRQRRRFRARSTELWLRYNGNSSPAGHETQREGTIACHLCSRFFKRKKLTIDHIVPKSLWSGYSECELPTNKVLVCRGCNQNKSDSMPDHPGCEICYQAIYIYSEATKTPF